MTPPILTRQQKLPFSQISWKHFEQLCLRLIRLDESIEYTQPYGVQGDEQGGIDIYARHCNDSHYTTYQCKNEKNFGPANIEAAVDVFLKGEWVQSSSVFVLCTRESLASKIRADAVEAQAMRLRKLNIKFLIWDEVNLCGLLKKHPDIVDDFFGRLWVKMFCGDEAAESISERIALPQRALSAHATRRRQLLVSSPCWGREKVWEDWTAWHRSGGYLLVTAPAGAGKSTALAHWLEYLIGEGTPFPRPKLCQYFFERKGILDFRSGLVAVAEQLLTAHGDRREVSESNILRTKELVRYLLERDYPSGLVIVLDGLDEIRERWEDEGEENAGIALLQDILPPKLGQGVSVVLSIRSTSGAETVANAIKMLGIEFSKHTILPPLHQDAVRLWFQRLTLPQEFLADEKQIHYWARRLTSHTEGHAVFLHHLMQEVETRLKNTTNIESDLEQILQKTPQGFEEYVLKNVGSVAARHKAWRHVLKFLAISHGLLSETDLLVLTKRCENPLSREDWFAIPWEIRRWLECGRTVDTIGLAGFEPEPESAKYWTISHPAIAQVFAQGIEIEYHRELVNYCQNWKHHSSLYALLHLFSHLLENRDWHAVMALSDDREYWQAVADYVPEEPLLELKFMKAAIQAAFADDKPVQAARFLLRYRNKIRCQSWVHPLRAVWLRKINGMPPSDVSIFQLRRAHHLIDLYAPADHTLWHLLLAAHLYSAGVPKMGKATLDRLTSGRNVKKLTGWRADFALFTLEGLLETLPPLIEEEKTFSPTSYIATLGSLVLEDHQLCTLAVHLESKERCSGSALSLMAEEGSLRRRSLLDVAKSLASSDPQMASMCFDQALHIINEQEDGIWRSWALEDVVATLVEVGWLGKALDIASEITDWPSFLKCHGKIAMAMINVSIDLSRGDVPAVIGKALTWDSKNSFATWLTTINSMEDSFLKTQCLQELSVAYAGIGEFSEGLSILSTLAPDERNGTHLELIQACININLDAAMVLTDPMEICSHKIEALTCLANEYVRIGNRENAQLLYRRAAEIFYSCKYDDEEERIDALTNLALAQVNSGFHEDALETVSLPNQEAWEGESWRYYVKIYRAIVQFYIGLSDFESASTWLLKMPMNNSEAIADFFIGKLQADLQPDESIFHRVEHLSRRSKSAGTRLALAAAKACRARGWSLEAYEPLARATAEYNEDPKAWQALSEALATVAEVLIESGDNQIASSLLDLSVQRSLDYQYGDGFFKEMRLWRIAHLQIQANSLDGARTTISLLDTERARVAVQKQIDAAQEGLEMAKSPDSIWFEDAIKPQLNIKSLVQQAVEAEEPAECAELWSAAALQAVSEGQKTLARDYFERATKKALESKDEEIRCYCLSVVLKTQAEAGMPDEVLEFLTGLDTRTYIEIDTVLQAISYELWNQNRREESSRVSNKIRHTGKKIETTCKLALRQFDIGEKEEARTAVRQLFFSVRRGELEDWMSTALEIIGVTLAQMGLPELALEAALFLSKSRYFDESNWLRLAEELAKQEDACHWQQLFIQSTELDIAPWTMCGQLAQIYPKSAKDIGKILSQSTPGRSRGT